MLKLVLYIIAAVLFGLAAIGWPKTNVQLGWAGACLFVVATLV